MAHKSLSELGEELCKAGEFVAIGGTYAHYKHPELHYKVTGLSVWEPTDEIVVLYEAQYGEHICFARPLEVWLETVEHEGATVPRFTKVAD